MLSGICKVPRLTQTEYDNLTTKPEFWILKDSSGSYKRLSADKVSYDNTSSGLTASEVQDAIDEVNLTNGGTITGNVEINNSGQTYSYVTIGGNDSIAAVSFKRPNNVGITNLIADQNTGNRNIHLPDATGVVALRGLLGSLLCDSVGNNETLMSKITSTASPQGFTIWNTQNATDVPSTGTLSFTLVYKGAQDGRWARLYCFIGAHIYHTSWGSTVPEQMPAWTTMI